MRQTPWSVTPTSSDPTGVSGEHVVRDVEQPLGGSSGAEARVELGRNGLSSHVVSFRSRRTPAEAACRAAASVEPSATPISS